MPDTYQYDIPPDQHCCAQERERYLKIDNNSTSVYMILSSILLISILSSNQTFSQIQPSYKPCIDIVKLYKSYQEYNDNLYSDSICLSEKKSKLSVFYNKLTIKDQKKKRKYPHGSLWRYKQGEDLFRFFDKINIFGAYGYHKVIGTNGLIIYSKKESGGYRMSSTYLVYFYSKDLSTPLERLSIKNLEKHFPNPSFINEVKTMKNLFESDTKGNLAINSIYNKYY